MIKFMVKFFRFKEKNYSFVEKNKCNKKIGRKHFFIIIKSVSLTQNI